MVIMLLVGFGAFLLGIFAGTTGFTQWIMGKVPWSK